MAKNKKNKKNKILKTKNKSLKMKKPKNKGKGNRPAGDQHPNAKISDADIKAARKAYKDGGITQRELAEHYGVSMGYMNRLLNGAFRA